MLVCVCSDVRQRAGGSLLAPLSARDATNEAATLRQFGLGHAPVRCPVPRAWHNIVSALRDYFGEESESESEDICKKSGMLELLLDAIGILSEKYVKNEANARCLSFLCEFPRFYRGIYKEITCLLKK